RGRIGGQRHGDIRGGGHGNRRAGGGAWRRNKDRVVSNRIRQVSRARCRIDIENQSKGICLPLGKKRRCPDGVRRRTGGRKSPLRRIRRVLALRDKGRPGRQTVIQHGAKVIHVGRLHLNGVGDVLTGNSRSRLRTF